MKRFYALLIPVLVIVLTVFALLPLTHAGFFTMHDDEQIARLYDLDQAIHAGNIPPRIAPNLGFGYGYPFFNFYPPFAYYVGEVFHLMGFSLIVSTKLMLVSGFVLSALFMYFFAKEFFGKWGGLVAGIFYTYASYHAIDVYVRGAFAEFYAFVFLPLIFWASYKAATTRKWRYVAIGSLGTAGFILSHNLIAFMSFPFLAVWLAYLLFISKEKILTALRFINLFLIGFGLSAYFFIPSYFERGHTLINILTSELANYSLHFVCVHQLWDSPWGYGGSIPGCYDGISFEIGKVPVLASLVSLGFALWFLKQKKLVANSVVVFLFAILLGFGTFLTTKFSKAIWDAIPPLWYVQFPWRYLLIISFLTSFLSAGIVGFFKQERVKIILSVVLILLVVYTSISRFVPERYFNAKDLNYTNLEKIRWETSSLAYEYVPKGVATKKSKEGTTLVAISKDEIAMSPFSVISGDIRVDVLKNLPQDKKFSVTVSKKGILQVNTYSFPGWHLFLNGREAAFQDDNKLKLMRALLVPGTYDVEAKFTDTPVRSAGNAASILSIILLAFGTFYFHSKKAL
ncbi:MAG: 6-pyruvoyl-tetrahydropterin synthase-related protein [Candidatus Levyibacteriota bacterium]